MTAANAVEQAEDADLDRRDYEPAPESLCYLPWCEECHGLPAVPIVDGDNGHHHAGTIGAVMIADVATAEVQVVTVALDRYDNDADDDPSGPTTGPTTIYLAVGGNAYLSPAEAQQTAQLLLEAVRVQQRFEHLANPNRVSGQDCAARPDNTSGAARRNRKA